MKASGYHGYQLLTSEWEKWLHFLHSSKLPMEVQRTDKMCPGSLRMALDIVGGTLICCFSLSGALPFNGFKPGGWNNGKFSGCTTL